MCIRDRDIIRQFQATGAREIYTPREAGNGTCVYVVTVGHTIVAVGEGSTGRLKALMPGQTCKKHTKALAVPLWAHATGVHPRFFVLNIRVNDQKRAKSKAKSLEKQLHRTFCSGVSKDDVLDLADRLGLIDNYGVGMLMACEDGDAYRLLCKYTDINKELGSYYTKGRRNER